MPAPVSAAEESAGRRIEEVIVTAEKRQSTVSDTSISITAFDSQMIDDLGLQSADELINFIPATTRDSYDIRIRGVGRNFRALGGDPGVATYYNGIYSPDFGIAASESALYDLERVEVLRGPQGTLYGRNSIGGALNYVTKRPTMEVEGELRTQFGAFNTREFYGMLSGPIIQDKLAARMIAVKRDRDGHQKGLNDAPDTDSIDDRNIALALQWRVTDNLEWNVRVNDRKSDRIIGGGVLLDTGTGANRSVSSNGQEVLGLRPLGTGETPADPGVLTFTDPRDGSSVYGAYRRAGVDPIGFPHSPNSFYGTPDNRPLGLSAKNPRNETQVNFDEEKCTKFPYDTCNSNHELFGHRSLQSDVTWDINDTMSLSYMFGHTDFEYTYNQDLDQTNVDFTKYRQTVLEDVWNYSHELQLNWSVGERFTATSGVYWYQEERQQVYSLSNTTPRFTEGVTDYGRLDDPLAIIGGASIIDFYCLASRSPGCGQVGLGFSELGNSDYGLYDAGDPRGDPYSQDNGVRNEASAIYTQGTYQFNDQWALVLGIRYAEDKKYASEIRGGYSEGDLSWVKGLATPEGAVYGPLVWLEAIGATPEGSAYLGTPGLTDLAAVNIAMGNAVGTGDPVNPITPNCAIDDPSCATPLRLSGIPISYSSYVEGNDKWSDTNFRVNVDWTPNEDILMYASFTTGYRAGGYQLGVTDARDQPRDPVTGQPISGASFEPQTYDKETVEAIEFGYKGMHFDGTLQLNASVYQYKYDGYQDRLNVFDSVRGRSVDIVQNADGVINRGFEVEALWLTTEFLTLGGNYSFTDAFYDEDYFVVENDNPDLPLSLFGNATTDPDLFVRNVKGDQLKRIPEHKATVWGSYDIPTASFGNWSLRADYSYTGEFQDSGITRELDLIPARHRVNVAVIWEDARRRWNIRGFVDNVTDESNIRGVGTAAENGNYRLTGTHLYPRYWGFDVRFRFGQ